MNILVKNVYEVIYLKKSGLKNFARAALALCLVLAVVLSVSACSLFEPDNTASKYSTQHRDGGKLGEGNNYFTFKVVSSDGGEAVFEVSTNQTIVGDALKELKLIDGDDDQYGLYVKSVNGENLDYNTDGKYWAFYVGGEYAVSGVDKTEIVNGTEYSFRAE